MIPLGWTPTLDTWDQSLRIILDVKNIYGGKKKWREKWPYIDGYLFGEAIPRVLVEDCGLISG
jgi:hypothetical protein